MTYRLELNPGSQGWCFKGNYGSPEAAWRKAQTYLERGKTSRLWNETTFRVFQLWENGGYGAQSQVRFRNSDAERGVVIAEMTNGTKVGAWLE
jgi:hypothetical protein